ncbi:MAG TPA: hybrid sensor histidine kinase/response regulator [Rhodobacteraceae bacterium]|jgi:nitrogen-specific signal transduction histidine kinase|nr:hybrid sensor histidine kinase/response regulator [Paracoccaceae bacterium]
MATSNAKNEKLTRAGLNLIGQALSIYDSDLCCVRVNRPFKEMFDLPEMLCLPGADFSETIRFLATRGEYGEVDDVDGFVSIRVEQARAFKAHYMERTRANGRTISVEGSPLPGGGWVTVYTDITAIKDQEKLLYARTDELSDQVLAHTEHLAKTNRELAATNAALQEAKHQLTEMEARARITTEMMPAHIAHVDRSGIYTYSNLRLSSIIPSRPSDIIGMHISAALGKSAFAKIKENYQKACHGTASVFEFTDDDSSRRIRVAFNPDQHGVYILSMDVTEETQTRNALAQTHKRELAVQLTSGMAHDFANLLTIILGMQSRLAKMDQPAEAAKMITATQSAARRGGSLLNRIASMSGPRQIHPTPVDLKQFINDLETIATPTLPSGVKLQSRFKRIEQPLLLDAGSLQDSLLNLILNAKDAIGNNTGEINLKCRSVRDTWLEITVSDTGSGFSQEALKHALDPFFTTKGGEGSGLGLSMVYDLTKLAGGDLKFANGALGAVITLRLPLRFSSAKPAAKMVLLVEDSDDIRASIREMLTEMGHKVIEATSAEEGCALAMLEGVNFVLSDISLIGETTGVEMLDQLTQKGLKAATCLMTSLPADNPIRVAGAKRYALIAKPFTATDLAPYLTLEPK